MRHGNWVPISKAFTKHLPKDRPYTELEAAYSIQVDYDNSNEVTITGYCDLWRWSKKRVYKFLDRMGVKIIYPDSTQKRQNQRGLIAVLIRDRKETDKRLIRFIDSNNIEAKGNRKETDKRLKRDRSGTATIDPNPKPNPEPKEFSPNSDEFRHANLLYDLILQNDPKAKEPNMQKWVCDIDKLHRLDGRSFEEIEATIQWCQKDDFWHTTILSAGKLRKQFQQLILKMKGNGNAANRTGKKTGFGKHGARQEGSRKYAHLG